jgi:hypothetical protein
MLRSSSKHDKTRAGQRSGLKPLDLRKCNTAHSGRKTEPGAPHKIRAHLSATNWQPEDRNDPDPSIQRRFPVLILWFVTALYRGLNMFRSEEALGLPATKQTIPAPQALRLERR